MKTILAREHIIARSTALTVELFAIFVVLYSLFTLGIGTLRVPGSGLWPLLIGLTLAATGLVEFFSTSHSLAEDEGFTPQSWISVFGLISFGIVVAFLPITGLILPMLLASFFWFHVLGKEKVVVSVISAVLCSFGMYYLFVGILGVRLPSDLIGTLLI